MKKSVKTTNKSEETFNFAKLIAKHVKAPYLIGLNGEIGTGKTIFAKGFAEGLNVKELVTSPTFLGVSESFSGDVPFIHMDFYKKVIEEENVYFYLKKKSIVLIEWYENYVSIFKKELNLDMRVYIQYAKDNEGNIQENKREITIEERNKSDILGNL